MANQNVICIMGPTACGKTATSIELALKHNYEIISVDSALVYRGMDIGTAKPTAEECQGVPHHLIDILDPVESYSAAQFRLDALYLISEIQAKGKGVCLVGGTMLYFKALQQGLAQLPQADEVIRATLSEQLQLHGLDYLHQQLSQVDIISAQRIDKNDPQRIMRALEVYQITGQPLSKLHAEQDEQSSYHFTNIAVIPNDRTELHAKIAQRFDLMLQQGFIDEVKQLHLRSDLNLDCPSMRSVGYRQVWQYLEGEYDYDTMREKAIIATRQLAKRQITWLRSWPDATIADSLNLAQLENSLSANR